MQVREHLTSDLGAVVLIFHFDGLMLKFSINSKRGNLSKLVVFMTILTVGEEAS